MAGQTLTREQKMDNYINSSTQDKLNTLDSMERKTLGDAPTYESGQSIVNAHAASMNRYADQFSRESYRDMADGDENFLNQLMAMNRNPEMEMRSRILAVTHQEQFYFRRSERSLAKAERYRRLSQNTPGLRAHAARHSNRSASKRAKKAREASKAYKKVARLQASYERSLEKNKLGERTQDEASVLIRGRAMLNDQWRAHTPEDYARLEEITEARIQALTLAAQAKSISKKQEDFSIQKGTLKNLLVLRDSLDQLVHDYEDSNKDPDERAVLKAKQEELNKRITNVSKRVDGLAPDPHNPNVTQFQ